MAFSFLAVYWGIYTKNSASEFMEDTIAYKTKLIDFKKYITIIIIMFVISLVSLYYRIQSIPLLGDGSITLFSMKVSFLSYVLIGTTGLISILVMVLYLLGVWNEEIVFTNEYFGVKDRTGIKGKIPIRQFRGVVKSWFIITISYSDNAGNEKRWTFYPPEPQKVFENLNRLLRRAE